MNEIEQRLNTQNNLLLLHLDESNHENMKKIVFALIACLALGNFSFSYAQPSTRVSMTASNWTVNSDDFKFENYLGVESIYLPSGFAELNDVVFHNGIIEFDIAFPEGRGFPGITFRRQDEANYEEFYIRPHQSGNPDANQYTPIFNGMAGWQLYYGEGYAAPIQYRYDVWNHVKLIIKGTVGEVYINDMDKPLFQIYELKHGDLQGPIAIKGNAKSHFANFSYRLDENPTLQLPVKELAEPDDNVIKTFMVSNAFEADNVIPKQQLEINKLSGLHWTKLDCEYTGTINLARIAQRTNKENAVLVKMTIISDQDQTKLLEFGYSDIAQVFVNGKAVYLGNNTYRSRDYRYLGTIGYFDAVFLELAKGKNEVVIAVMEAFGGWGLKARLSDKDGIELE